MNLFLFMNNKSIDTRMITRHLGEMIVGVIAV